MGPLGFHGLDDGPRVIDDLSCRFACPRHVAPVAPYRRRTAMRRVASVLVALAVFGVAVPVAAAPEGQVTWAIHVSLASTWFEPAATSGIITPFVVVYVMHDAMVQPLPGKGKGENR